MHREKGTFLHNEIPGRKPQVWLGGQYTPSNRDVERDEKCKTACASYSQTGALAPAWSGRPIWGKPDMQAEGQADSGEKLSPAR